ncbi:MAG TPA: glycerophosphodiester phosphodiesterase family protein [Armatimonadota bacterium]|nr:glycerophosphodiester phosphodiesterase family protein [Armatimonadota bacterium]HOS43926.1 glycerophosphodiester phosphodiesterase family protein [Armatimonadota bacterium]
MVKVVAHRGFSGRYPENTARALTEALRLGVEMIEFDLHLSADDELIVIHDSTVDRTANGAGDVARLTLAEIKALDAGAWFGAEFAGERFLTAREALALLAETGVELNIHVKAYAHDRERVIDLTLAEMTRFGVLARAFIASDEASIALAKHRHPAVRTCNLSTHPRDDYIARSLAVGCRILQPGHQQVDAAFVSDAHRHGMTVNPFYADEPEEMRRLIACGVDGILTNHPDRLLALR